jgi:CHAD domain-containing protein
MIPRRIPADGATLTPARPQRLPDPVLASGSRRIADVLVAQQAQLQAVVARLSATGVEDVHQGRVAARRLRSILKTFGPLFDARWVRLYRIDLRSFARALATVREADVIGEVLKETLRSGAGLRPAELVRLKSSLQQLRTDVRNRLHQHSREPGWRALTVALATRAGHPPRLIKANAAWGDVLKLADGAWRKATRLLERRPGAAAELHELRLALKHCRYALEAVADIEPKATSRLLRRLRRAQEKIGAHRDTIAAAHWVRSHERTLGRGTMVRLEAALIEREARLRKDAAGQSEKVLPAYEAWREAIGPLTRAVRAGRA